MFTNRGPLTVRAGRASLQQVTIYPLNPQVQRLAKKKRKPGLIEKSPKGIERLSRLSAPGRLESEDSELSPLREDGVWLPGGNGIGASHRFVP